LFLPIPEDDAEVGQSHDPPMRSAAKKSKSSLQRPILNFAPRGKTLTPRGEAVPRDEFCSLCVKFVLWG
jgi:hypothetical protein